MSRHAPEVREATPGDAEELLELWATSARQGDSAPRPVEDAARGLANVAADPDTRLLVAVVDEQIAAALQVGRGQISPLVEEEVVHTSFLLVRPEHRKQGIARCLLEAAVAWAEEKDAHAITAVTDTNRETNRFFARLGLATFATVRYSTTPALRKRLSEGARVPGGNRHLREVLAQRRSMRRRLDEE
jgi:GNAT superfamily N-acetyltransferase